MTWFCDLTSVAARAALGLHHEAGQHVGVFFESTDLGGRTSWMFLHLAWHHDLRSDSVTERTRRTYRVVPVRSLEELPELADGVIAYCDRIRRERLVGGLAYGFGWAPDGISDEPRALEVSTSGLTCATFALAVLRKHVQLDYASWRDQPEDADWKTMVLQQLERNGAPREHLRAVEADADAPRIRPTHVAAAATCEDPPARYEWAKKRATELLEHLAAP